MACSYGVVTRVNGCLNEAVVHQKVQRVAVGIGVSMVATSFRQEERRRHQPDLLHCWVVVHDPFGDCEHVRPRSRRLRIQDLKEDGSLEHSQMCVRISFDFRLAARSACIVMQSSSDRIRILEDMIRHRPTRWPLSGKVSFRNI